MKEAITIKLVRPHVEIIPHMHHVAAAKLVATMGRICYASEAVGNDADFIRKRLSGDDKHESVIEHVSLSAIITCTRDNSHEIVRHRLCAFSQSSQRYINYDKKGFAFICPEHIDLCEGQYVYSEYDGCTTPSGQERTSPEQTAWLMGRVSDVIEYQSALDSGKKPEIARQCLPNCTMTIIGMTCNIREWRHVFKMRALSPRAQKTTRDLFRVVYDWFVANMPWFVEDLVDNAKGM